jgi:hypothetical protein
VPGDFFASATNSCSVEAGTCGPTTNDIALVAAKATGVKLFTGS